MKITSSNLVKDAFSILQLTDFGGDSGDNLRSFDFSKNVAGAGVDATMSFRFTFVGISNISYVAIAGHTLVGKVQLFLDSALIDEYVIPDNRNSCIMFIFPEQAVGNFDLVFDKQGAASTVMLVSHVAAGLTFDVPNAGEQSGYSRLWLAPSIKQQVVINNSAGPVAIINKTISQKASLNIPNMPRSVAEGSYRDLCDFMMSSAFFVLERDDTKNSSYLCFDTKINAPKAHNSTRELVNASFSFNAYTGGL